MVSPGNRVRIGRTAEGVAASFLARNGYQILLRNYRTRRGEIDIIARDGGTIVFVEVKARRHGIDSSLEAVDFRKRRRIVRAALHFITTRRLDGVSFRFDVVAVTLGRAGVVRAIHLEKNAFAVDE